jgi:hypothetical protein
VEIRLTEAEIKTLTDLAAGAGMTLSDFMRARAFGAKPRINLASPERAEFIKALAGLGKIGSNVNQIAKALNSPHAGGRIGVSSDNISSTLYALQTLSKNLIKHLTDGHTR